MAYVKECFDVVTFEQAKHVVLSNDPNDPEKFEKETNFLVDTIQKHISLTDTSTVLDFGCGMGRVSKELIKRFQCNIIGLDISPSMLMFAKLYTANMDKFKATHSYTLPDSIDVAISIFAIQHVENAQKELDNIINVLKPNGIFILLNERNRWIPGSIDRNNMIEWEDDGFDVFSYTESKLKLFNTIQYMNKDQYIFFYKKEL